MPRWTMSKDGIPRTTVCIKARYTAEEWEFLKRCARHDKKRLSDFLYDQAVHEGIGDLWYHRNEDGSYREG